MLDARGLKRREWVHDRNLVEEEFTGTGEINFVIIRRCGGK